MTSRMYHSIENIFINKKEILREVKMSIYKTVWITHTHIWMRNLGSGGEIQKSAAGYENEISATGIGCNVM